MNLPEILVSFFILLSCSCGIVTVLEHADVNSTYPELDFGIGFGYTCIRFENYESFGRLGWFSSFDFNPDLHKPDWVSLGVFLSREIQPNITVGFTVGRRFFSISGVQYGAFLGIDLWPFNH